MLFPVGSFSVALILMFSGSQFWADAFHEGVGSQLPLMSAPARLSTSKEMEYCGSPRGNGSGPGSRPAGQTGASGPSLMPSLSESASVGEVP